jgi:hypothetical protein
MLHQVYRYSSEVSRKGLRAKRASYIATVAPYPTGDLDLSGYLEEPYRHR